METATLQPAFAQLEPIRIRTATGELWEAHPIGGEWFRRDAASGEIHYTWGPPDATGGHMRMQVIARLDGLHVLNNTVPLRTEEDLDGLERVLMLAHRQYDECLSMGAPPHDVTDDRLLYNWLGDR